MFIGERAVAADPVAAAADMIRAGARHAVLPETVDLTGDDPASGLALGLVRELTGHGAAVDWRLELGDSHHYGALLSHLFPPSRLSCDPGPGDLLAAWRRDYHLAKLCFRRGPDFIQVRDYRWGNLRRHVIRTRDYEHTFVPLLNGAPAGSLPPTSLSGLRAAELVIEVKDEVCWLPYRLKQWPLCHMVI
jgi:hypothetical protein